MLPLMISPDAGVENRFRAGARSPQRQRLTANGGRFLQGSRKSPPQGHARACLFPLCFSLCECALSIALRALKHIRLISVQMRCHVLKQHSERAIRSLCHEWRRVQIHAGASPRALSFEDFYRWLGDSYPQTLTFKRREHVPHWVRLWFEQELGYR